MSEPVKHAGAGMGETPELLVRQVLLEGFVELAGDAVRIDELFARVDDLLQGTAEEWRDDFRTMLRRMAQVGDDGGIRIGVGYPAEHIRLPYVSVVPESGSENAGGASMGDLIQRTYEQSGTPSATDPSASRTTRHSVYGVDWTTNVQVGSWALAPEEATVLHTVIRHLLFRHKGRLTTAGVRELSFSESGFQPDPTYYPRTLFVPTIRCGMDWTFRNTRRTKPVPTRVTMRSGTFSVTTE